MDSTTKPQAHIDLVATERALSLALAAVVQAADRVPAGSPARRALAEAAEPLRDLLYGS